MTKNPFKLKIIDKLKIRDYLTFFGVITSFLTFKESSFIRIAWALRETALLISITFLAFVEIELLYRQDRVFQPLKNSVFSYRIRNSRIRTITLITTNFKKLNLNRRQFVIVVYPFLLTASFCIRSRYKEQLFSYLVKETLPGLCVSQHLSWDTFTNISYKKIVPFHHPYAPTYSFRTSESQYHLPSQLDVTGKFPFKQKFEYWDLKYGKRILRTVTPGPSAPRIDRLSLNEENRLSIDKEKDKVFRLGKPQIIQPILAKSPPFMNPEILEVMPSGTLEGGEVKMHRLVSDLEYNQEKVEYERKMGLLLNDNDLFGSRDNFGSHAEREYPEKDKPLPLPDNDFIERIDVDSNCISLELKPTWEQKEKQFYIGFLPKNKISLNKLPLFFDGKQKDSSMLSIAWILTSKGQILTSKGHKAHSQKENFHISNVPLQIKNTKNNNKEKFPRNVHAKDFHKFYARKQNFLRSYKDKISLKNLLINKKPNLINLFSKQQFQQEFFDLDELPLQFEKSYSRNQAFYLPSSSNIVQDSINPNPNYIALLLRHKNPNFSEILLKSLNLLEDKDPLEGLQLRTTFSKHPFPTISPSQEPVYKKLFIENELKKGFYSNEEFFASTPLYLTDSFTNLKQTFSAVKIFDFKRAVCDFKMRTFSFFDLFDYIQPLLLNLEKNHISLNLGPLPEQSGLSSSRIVTGYSYPDMEITNLRSSRIQKFSKNILFKKQKKKILPMKIELPSSVLKEDFEYDFSKRKKKTEPVPPEKQENPSEPLVTPRNYPIGDRLFTIDSMGYSFPDKEQDKRGIITKIEPDSLSTYQFNKNDSDSDIKAVSFRSRSKEARPVFKNNRYCGMNYGQFDSEKDSEEKDSKKLGFINWINWNQGRRGYTFTSKEKLYIDKDSLVNVYRRNLSRFLKVVSFVRKYNGFMVRGLGDYAIADIDRIISAIDRYIFIKTGGYYDDGRTYSVSSQDSGYDGDADSDVPIGYRRPKDISLSLNAYSDDKGKKEVETVGVINPKTGEGYLYTGEGSYEEKSLWPSDKIMGALRAVVLPNMDISRYQGKKMLVWSLDNLQGRERVMVHSSIDDDDVRNLRKHLGNLRNRLGWGKKGKKGDEGKKGYKGNEGKKGDEGKKWNEGKEGKKGDEGKKWNEGNEWNERTECRMMESRKKPDEGSIIVSEMLARRLENDQLIADWSFPSPTIEKPSASKPFSLTNLGGMKASQSFKKVKVETKGRVLRCFLWKPDMLSSPGMRKPELLVTTLSSYPLYEGWKQDVIKQSVKKHKGDGGQKGEEGKVLYYVVRRTGVGMPWTGVGKPYVLASSLPSGVEDYSLPSGVEMVNPWKKGNKGDDGEEGKEWEVSRDFVRSRGMGKPVVLDSREPSGWQKYVGNPWKKGNINPWKNVNKWDEGKEGNINPWKNVNKWDEGKEGNINPWKNVNKWDEGKEGHSLRMGDEAGELPMEGELRRTDEAVEGYEMSLQQVRIDNNEKGLSTYAYETVIREFIQDKVDATTQIRDFLKFPPFKSHYLPASKTLLNKYLLEKFTISGLFKRIPTLYTQEINLSSKLFALLPLSLWGDISSFYEQQPVVLGDYSEPLTIHLWLVITKLSFAFSTRKYLKNFILNEGKFILRLFSEELKEGFGLSDKKKDKGYRLIEKVQKGFQDVAGIDNILTELGELVWVLRKHSRSFTVGRFYPKGFLLVGPPGTGKTLLAQAIAGEAKVPVLIQSGISLTDPQKKQKVSQRLKKLFKEARKLAPCIVFMDEMDTLGKSRKKVMSYNVEADHSIHSFYEQVLLATRSRYSVNQSKDRFFEGNLTDKKSRGLSSKRQKEMAAPSDLNILEEIQQKKNLTRSIVKKKIYQEDLAKETQLTLLMQFLVELDGLKSRTGVIVIGATNRPQVLDPALTRPGRLERVMSLEMPGKTKRIEILKLYSQNIGLIYGEIPQISSTTEQAKPKESFSDISNTKHAFGDQDFAWEYLANRTVGFSAADLAVAMNLSSIQSILRNTGHTIETIEQGIELITTYSRKKAKIKRTTEKDKDPFFITRFAYYQAGKAVLYTLLPQHPDAIVLKLWPQPKNSRHKYVNMDLTSGSLTHRAQLETRLIGFYAGKAAELLALSLNSQTKKETKTTNTRKRSSTIKENKGPNRKTVSLLRTKNALRNRYVITSPKQNLTNQDLCLPLAASTSSFFKSSIFTTLPDSNPTGRENASHYQEKQAILSDLSPKTNTIKTKQMNLRTFAPLPDKNVLFVRRDIRLQANSFDVSGEIKQKNQQVHSQYNKRNLWHSSLGIEDLSVASNLAHSLVEKWHFYSNKIGLRRENQLITDQNRGEISDFLVFGMFEKWTEDIQKRISASNISQSTAATQNEEEEKEVASNAQEWLIKPWWLTQITDETLTLNLLYDHWYSIYLSDPELNKLNLHWIPPEKYYHNTQNLKNLLPKSSYRKNSYLLPTFKNLTNPKIPGLCLPLAASGSLPYSNPAGRGNASHYQEKQGRASGMLLKSSILTSKGYKEQRGFMSELNNNKRKIDIATAAKLNILKDFSKTSAFNSHVKEKNNRSKNKKKAFEGPRREFIFKNRPLQNKLNFDVTWNDLYKLDRDYIYHALILTCFNKAFSLLDENRELLDYLADYLMRFETLRQHEIKQIFYEFGYSSLPLDSLIKKG